MKLPINFCLLATLFLAAGILSAASDESSGVSKDPGAQPNDVQLFYGFQYQSVPRHAGPYSDASTLPGTLIYTPPDARWKLQLDGVTWKTVDYPSMPRASGNGDMDVDIGFTAAKPATGQLGVTLDYLLFVPAGDPVTKLGTGQYSHRPVAGLTWMPKAPAHKEQLWTFQSNVGSVITRKSAAYYYNSAIFGALSVTRAFPILGDALGAPRKLKFEVDVIPAYSFTAKPGATSSNIRVGTEVYTVTTFTEPLAYETKVALAFRVGLTPYTPKFVVSIQFQHLFRKNKAPVSSDKLKEGSGI